MKPNIKLSDGHVQLLSLPLNVELLIIKIAAVFDPKH